jgi:uncharacterized DUF497 family protein
VRYEWDPQKAAQNLRKHRVSFVEAATVFADPLAVTFDDPDHSSDERRFITIGCSSADRLLFVAHAEWETGIRIISARKATRKETHDHEEGAI